MQTYDKEQNLSTDIDIQIPNIWTLLNKDNMTNALAICLVIFTVSSCFVFIRSSANPVVEQKQGR